MDRNHDDNVDLTDVASFLRCATGPDVEWVATDNCAN
jgi:hypothetical protein